LLFLPSILAFFSFFQMSKRRSASAWSNAPFLHAIGEVVLVHHTRVAEDGTAGIAGLGTFLEPVQRLVGVHLDERGVLVGIVSADPFDVLPVAWCTGIGYYDVVVRPAFFAFTLKADASWHVAVCVGFPELGVQMCGIS
jgi:hypothetical protein